MKKKEYHSMGLEHIRTWCAVVSLILSTVILTVVVLK